MLAPTGEGSVPVIVVALPNGVVRVGLQQPLIPLESGIITVPF
jgi:hypothetical protein